MCIVLNGALDTLLMYHISLCKIWVVTKRPSELLRLNQEHVCSGASVIPRVPYAAVAKFVELMIAKLKESFV